MCIASSLTLLITFIFLLGSGAFTIFTPSNPANEEFLPPADAWALTSVSYLTILLLWSHLTSLPFAALKGLFPQTYVLTEEKMAHLKHTLSSYKLSISQMPDARQHQPHISLPPLLFFRVSALSPPFNLGYFNLTPQQLNTVLVLNLSTRCESDQDLCMLFASRTFSPVMLAEQTGFLYNAQVRCPVHHASVDDDKTLISHFQRVLIEELSTIASLGRFKAELEASIKRDTDLQLLKVTDLTGHSTAGLTVFRFTPASIPASFHDDLTSSLSSSLSSLAPTVYRAATTTLPDAQQAIVVELNSSVLQKTVPGLLAELKKMRSRIPLPADVESHLSAELKKSISEAENKMKAAGGGGVIRAIPIVGSFFSYFAGKPKPKGHTYTISTTAPATQSSTSTSSSASKTKPPSVSSAAPSTDNHSVSSSNTLAAPVLPSNTDTGVFSRGSSAAFPPGAEPKGNLQQQQEHPDTLHEDVPFAEDPLQQSEPLVENHEQYGR